jgi:hypothetical protein
MLSVQFDDEMALTMVNFIHFLESIKLPEYKLFANYFQASMEDSYVEIRELAIELRGFERIRRQIANSIQHSRAKTNPLKVDKFKCNLHTPISLIS